MTESYNLHFSTAYKAEGANSLPTSRYRKAVVAAFPVMNVSITIVKLVKLYRLDNGVFNFVLSDEVDKPGTTTFFLATVTYKDSRALSCWLVDEKESFWPLYSVVKDKHVPGVDGRGYMVGDYQVNIGAEEHQAVIEAIKRYADEK